MSETLKSLDVLLPSTTFEKVMEISFSRDARDAGRTQQVKVVVDLTGANVERDLIPRAGADFIVAGQRSIRGAESEEQMKEFIDGLPKEGGLPTFRAGYKTIGRKPEMPKTLTQMMEDVSTLTDEQQLELLRKLRLSIGADEEEG